MKLKIVLAIASAILVVFFLHKELHSQNPSKKEEARIDNRAELIDTYFTQRGMPLAGYGQKFVEVADQYNLDYRLLPALAVRESSGGLHRCGYNPFGWGSCRLYNFSSFDQAIETVGMKLGTLPYYKGKPIIKVLQTYNPPTVVPNYAQEVMSIMASISNE